MCVVSSYATRTSAKLALGMPCPYLWVQAIRVITPTNRPLEALAASLTRDAESVTATATLMDDMARDGRSLHLYVRELLSHPPSVETEGAQGGERLLLVVDQFEELFTLCRDEAERQAFVYNLMTAVAPGCGGRDLLCS